MRIDADADCTVTRRDVIVTFPSSVRFLSGRDRKCSLAFFSRTLNSAQQRDIRRGSIRAPRGEEVRERGEGTGLVAGERLPDTRLVT